MSSTQTQKTRTDSIREYVALNPGSTSVQIADALAVNRSNISSHLAELVKDGRIWRAGLRCDYVYFADEGLCMAAAHAIAEKQRAERAANRRDAVARGNALRAKRREAKRAAMAEAGDSVSRRKPRSSRLEGRVEAYIAKHQGCTAVEIYTNAPIGKHSVGGVLSALSKAGVIFSVGIKGPGGYRYYTDRALYEASQAEFAGRKERDMEARRKASAQRHAEARERVAERQRQRAERDMRSAERRRLADEQKLSNARKRAEAREIAAAAARAAQKAAREAKEAKRKREPMVRASKLSTQPVVRLARLSGQATDELHITEHTRYTVAPTPPGRFEPTIGRGMGAISDDWMARRQGVEIPSRLKGVYA